MKINAEIIKIIKNALKEDIRNGDITTEIFVDKKTPFRGVMLCKEKGILCGTEIAAETFKLLNPETTVKIFKKDGAKIKKGETLMEVRGDRTLLSAERTALNFVQRLSGIASASARFAALVRGSESRIYDTRKTVPGLRILEKYAVRTGGCFNHRFGLYDAFMVKDNHLACLKNSEEFHKKAALARKRHKNKILEVEVQNLSQLKGILPSAPDIIMLDNMSFLNMKKAITLIRKTSVNSEIEISGGITEKKLKNLLKLKVGRISVGALTHSVKALDISLDIREFNGPSEAK